MRKTKRVEWTLFNKHVNEDAIRCKCIDKLQFIRLVYLPDAEIKYELNMFQNNIRHFDYNIGKCRSIFNILFC